MELTIIFPSLSVFSSVKQKQQRYKIKQKEFRRKYSQSFWIRHRYAWTNISKYYTLIIKKKYTEKTMPLSTQLLRIKRKIPSSGLRYLISHCCRLQRYKSQHSADIKIRPLRFPADSIAITRTTAFERAHHKVSVAHHARRSVPHCRSKSQSPLKHDDVQLSWLPAKAEARLESQLVMTHTVFAERSDKYTQAVSPLQN